MESTLDTLTLEEPKSLAQIINDAFAKADAEEASNENDPDSSKYQIQNREHADPSQILMNAPAAGFVRPDLLVSNAELKAIGAFARTKDMLNVGKQVEEMPNETEIS